MSNPCITHWKSFVALGILIGRLCSILGELIYDIMTTKNDKVYNKRNGYNFIKKMENEMKKCGSCGREVPEHNIDKYGECGWCRADERANNMCVGDMKDK